MNIPNNQVLRQISDFDCECGDDFKQPFEQTDISKLWVELPILGSIYRDWEIKVIKD